MSSLSKTRTNLTRLQIKTFLVSVPEEKTRTNHGLSKLCPRLEIVAGSARSLVMIGDCNPHGPNYPLNKEKINWREECQHLKEADIRVYAVQALNRREADAFYRYVTIDSASFFDSFSHKIFDHSFPPFFDLPFIH